MIAKPSTNFNTSQYASIPKLSQMGTLYYGDNLEVLRKHIKTESVDLIYLDPPFNSNVNYNVIFKTNGRNDSPSQIQAFEDTWTWGDESEMVYAQILGIGDRISDVIRGLREAIGENDMMAYVTMMAIRLIELHRVLKKTGSLYLHCDPTASHYLKVILDAIFNPENFRTEIIWKRTSAHSDTKQGRKQYGRIHDTILFYSKSTNNTWNPMYTPYDESYVNTFYKHVESETGRRYQLTAIDGPGGASKGNPRYEVMGVTRYWRYSKKRMNELIQQGKIIQTKPGNVPREKKYLDEMPGIPLQDIWIDIKPISSQAKERLGYPTQKPIVLLERIILASSNEGDVILDPFCGCGTATHASQKLNRKWIGIDVTHLAIGLIEYRMKQAFGTHPVVKGVPTSFESAENLAERDKFQFEAWAVTRIDGIMPNQKKGKDRGIDGRGYIPIGNDVKGNPKHAKVIVSVKGGQRLTPAMVRDLKGTVTRENAEFGIFICIKEPTAEMRKEASTGGIFETPLGTKHPKIQIFTIKDYFDGRHPDLPQISNMFRSPDVETMQNKSKQLTLNPI